MLPGFRFLFAATFLTMSLLVFGLGAAALLRAAHERFATNPAWHAAPEATFAQQVEPTRPVLAMLRVGGPAAEQKASGNTPGADVPAIPAPTERTMTVPASAEHATIAGLKSAALPAGDMPTTESPGPTSAAAAAAGDAPASDTTKIATSVSGGETDRATPKRPSPPDQAASPATGVDAAASPPATAPASPDADIASTKIATLDTPSVIVEAKPPGNAASAKLDPSVVKKQLRARRAAHRRRMAARAARLAWLAAQQLLQQQAADPFGLRFAQPAAAAAEPTRRAVEFTRIPSAKPVPALCGMRANQAGPVATCGPSGKPHSDHEPS